MTDGLCGCGCGRVTGITTHNRPERGLAKGDHFRFVRGHSAFRGTTIRNGYRYIHIGKGKYETEHTLIAQSALGHKLPPRAQVHHYNEIKLDNSRGNLVVCEDRAYHSLLHRRQRARAECGNPNARRCLACHTYARQDEIVLTTARGVPGRRAYHRSCCRAKANPKNPIGPRDRTHCAQGHAFTPDNTYYAKVYSSGNLARRCRACRDANAAVYRKAFKRGSSAVAVTTPSRDRGK